jgi:hypothetical protein
MSSACRLAPRARSSPWRRTRGRGAVRDSFRAARSARNEPNLCCSAVVSASSAPSRVRGPRAQDGEARRLRWSLSAGSGACECSPTRHAGRERPAAPDADPGGAIGGPASRTDPECEFGVASPRAARGRWLAPAASATREPHALSECALRETWTATPREDPSLVTHRVRDTAGLASCHRAASAAVRADAREARGAECTHQDWSRRCSSGRS